jgi:hypothetical protein
MARLSYSTFNNFIFVAPIAINLSSYDKLGAFHAPSVMVSACLCERALATPVVAANADRDSLSNADDHCIEGLQCCIGKSSVPSLVSCSVNSHVSEFTKFPIFHDVMKMTLKPKIAHGTHILFTVYDVNTKSGRFLSKVSKVFFQDSNITPLKQVIGYAFTTIDGGVSNPANDTELPLYRELPADYISMAPAALEQYRILPFELPLHVSLTYQSTIQPKHPQLVQFFRDYSCFIEILHVFESLKSQKTHVSIDRIDKNLLQAAKHIKDSLCALKTSPNESLHHYFSVLCNQILCIVCGSLQILAHESPELDKSASVVRRAVVQGDEKFEYTALEETHFLKSVFFRQRVFGDKLSGSGLWLTLADVALESIAGVFSQIETQKTVRLPDSSSNPLMHVRIFCFKYKLSCTNALLQLPGDRSIMKRTYVEEVFDNLKNERGIVGFYLILAWHYNLQNRSSSSDSSLNDLEQHIGKTLLFKLSSY